MRSMTATNVRMRFTHTVFEQYHALQQNLLLCFFAAGDEDNLFDLFLSMLLL